MLRSLEGKSMIKVRIPTKGHYQIEVTELKNTVTELKNTIKGFNSELMKQKKE